MNNVPCHVLFLDNSNSTRSIMAEVLLRHWGGVRFVAHREGSHPFGEVHPMALEGIEYQQLPTYGLRSKSWDEFAGDKAPPLEFVFIVDDAIASESYPSWNGSPIVTNWGVPDPTTEQRNRREQIYAFRRTLKELELRVKAFVDLPFANLDAAMLRERLTKIGSMRLLRR